MKKLKQLHIPNLIIFLCMIIFILCMCFLTYFVFTADKKCTVIENNIDKTKTVIETNIDDWNCIEVEDTYTDLLQPSGVWGFKTFNCNKLEKTIEEYCFEYPERCID